MQEKRVTLERTFDASIDDVWDLWTTKGGIESWWGPEGFRVEVKKIELRPSGELLYDMIAVAPGMVAFMKQTFGDERKPAKIVYTEVTPKSRLAYDHLADFIPNVKPYDVATLVELVPGESGVRMRLTFDAMHDDLWTERQTAGWTSELGKLAQVIAAKG